MAMEMSCVRRIVVATDLTERTADVLVTAVAYGRTFDASLDLVHVREPIVHTSTEGFASSPEGPRDDELELIDDRLAALADSVTHAGLPCVTSSLEGITHRELVRHAQKTNADLIVVGSHERGPILHAVLGSVAERVVQRAGCPVLVVPTTH
jgi:nucleotide-binding universal stress UspA family protein